ncbi:TonB-dependent receptor [Dyella caseinilytica]|uniref:TonB-dependent receptor n=1 Tax=Dyella caseinilytica TaxID=1849581 RepID=A0ABX7GT58_9GAMM|nr:TonB-dependent receptor [Dyella caseinilytica]QRN53644.1 TonB-dependent receptor [Dyella caseinilytica]GFZ88165.1 TonB-dependent receptor [Dyella caseinilytica]
MLGGIRPRLVRTFWRKVVQDAGARGYLLCRTVRCAGVTPWVLSAACLTGAAPYARAYDTPAALHTYAIRPGNLRDALDAFAAEGNIQLVYAPELAEGKVTGGVSGRFAPGDALRQLLAGTGVTWTTVNATTFVLQRSPTFHPPAARPAVVETSVAIPTQTLRPVNVSGSLIGNAAIQTATPTYTITADEIKARGFNNISDVLQSSVLATGSVQGPQYAGTFTQGAQTVSLFGLSPEFALILVDGKPLANFGPLYNGTNNFTNISNLPISMIDHIDVMPGGASSIYGSQAIGGVINIVTREHLDGGEISVRAGGYSDGGGANQRLSFAYGHDFGALRVLTAGEFDNASPIWGFQRPLTIGSNSGPAGSTAPNVQAQILNYGTFGSSAFTGYPLSYLDPPAGCDTRLFGGTTTLINNTSPLPGQYCGSNKQVGYVTYSNQARSYDGMLKLDYRVSDSLRLYADALLDWQQQRWYPGLPTWTPADYPHGSIEDATSGDILKLVKTFAPEEMPGGLVEQMYRQQDLLYQADIGASGQLGESGWNWDIYYVRSGDRTDVVEPLWISTSVDRFFSRILGPQLGTDPASGVQLYNPNYQAFFQPVTTAQYNSFSQNLNEFSNTWINDTRATLSNASLFALPGGDAGFAAIIEAGGEAWYQPVDPLLAQNEVFQHAGTGGGGQRSHAASAFELNLPLLKSLTLDLSGRYDHYALDEGSDNHKFTYKIGIEFRPLDSLLFRGSYNTAFKAPDLASIFLGPTDYYAQITDYYACAQAHSATCGSKYQYYVKGITLANPQLQPTSAQNWSLGSVWSPLDGFSISVDYLHMAIRDEVVQQDLDLLMHTDAQCLLGQLNADSAECRAAIGQVQRMTNNGPVNDVTTYYANLTDETIRSFISSARYRFTPLHIGSFVVQLDYNDMLGHTYQIAPGQPPINLLANPLYSTEFKSAVSGSVTWTSPGGYWTSTVYGHRYGPSPNYAAQINGPGTPGAGPLPPWITFNGSVSYRPTRNLEFSLLLNNIANKMPPVDPTYTTYPYYNVENYNVYGREIMLQADLKLGGAAH